MADAGGRGAGARPILVGKVAGAFGVRGELRIVTYTDDPLALLRYRDLLDEAGGVVLRLETARVAKDGAIVRASSIGSKEAADALRGLRLFVARDALPDPADADEFYLADLIGLEARDPEGLRLGVIKAVHDFGAGDILELDPRQGRSTLMVTFTRAVAPEVRIADGFLTVILPAEDEGYPPVNPEGR